MTREEAKDILLLYRPGTLDSEDLEVAEAIELARTDAELGCWLEEHQAFQSAMRAKLRQLPVPAGLKGTLLAVRPKIVFPPFWHRAPLWAAAAAVLLVAFVLFFRSGGTSSNDRFSNYQEMMVSKALRGYVMDWTTSDLEQLRRQLAQTQAPADYSLPRGVANLQVSGAAHLTWRTHPVAMVCFKRQDQRDVWLFVMKRTALKDPPPAAPQLARVDRVMTASWSRGDEVYVLAGPPEQDFLERYF